MAIMESSAGEEQRKKKVIATWMVELWAFFLLGACVIFISEDRDNSWYYLRQGIVEIRILWKFLACCFLVFKPYFIHGWTGLILLVLSGYGFYRDDDFGESCHIEIKISKMENIATKFCWAAFVVWLVCRVLR